jgi:glycosyltransferase involved in cell wall biosynthesis
MQIGLDIFDTNRLHPIKGTGLLSMSRHVDTESSAKYSPLVSCVMVTRGDTRLISSSLHSFNMQSYRNKELVIVSLNAHVAKFISDMCLDNVRFINVENQCSLGELRNIAISSAAGEIICQWDDDDLYDKDRLRIQTSSTS